MSLKCRRMRSRSLAATAGRATDAERLELEEHLEICPRCQSDHDRLQSLQSLRAWHPPGLSDVARERVRRNALWAAGRARHADRPVPWRWRTALRAGGVAAALLALTGLGLWLTPAPCRVIAGDISGARAGRIPDGALLRSARGGSVVLAGPRVDLEPGTEVIWDAAARTVALARGVVTVDVDPAQGGRFRVLAPQFMVEVLGTRFSVSVTGVRTERGVVRVSRRDGTVVAHLTAGEAWSVPPPVVVAPPASCPAAAPAAPALASAPVPAASAPASALSEEQLLERLARARRALVRGDAAEARAVLRPLAHAPRRVALEARMLQAQSYLVERRYGEAIASYQAVTRAYGGTPHAESALYAIAQLEMDRDRHEAARDALSRYLSRHPRGRFVREARERLERLSRTPGR
ncbi:MAG TPA: tetratricopeptide repeat protein [Polyangia bacterium]|jgi:ferric-dicitrate binding protein FerR (iron transport regulator)